MKQLDVTRMILIAITVIIGVVLFMALGGLVVQLLWNWLLPPLFGWPALGYWQALGLLALCRILFGNVGGSRRYGDGRHRRREAWEHLTPEEVERFRQSLREREGVGAPAASAGE